MVLLSFACQGQSEAPESGSSPEMPTVIQCMGMASVIWGWQESGGGGGLVQVCTHLTRAGGHSLTVKRERRAGSKEISKYPFWKDMKMLFLLQGLGFLPSLSTLFRLHSPGVRGESFQGAFQATLSFSVHFQLTVGATGTLPPSFLEIWVLRT